MKRFYTVLLQKCYFQKCLGPAMALDQSVGVRMFPVHSTSNWVLWGVLCVLREVCVFCWL